MTTNERKDHESRERRGLQRLLLDLQCDALEEEVAGQTLSPEEVAQAMRKVEALLASMGIEAPPRPSQSGDGTRHETTPLHSGPPAPAP